MSPTSGAKIHAQGFRGEEHLRSIIEEAQTIVSEALTESPHVGDDAVVAS